MLPNRKQNFRRNDSIRNCLSFSGYTWGYFQLQFWLFRGFHLAHTSPWWRNFCNLYCWITWRLLPAFLSPISNCLLNYTACKQHYHLNSSRGILRSGTILTLTHHWTEHGRQLLAQDRSIASATANGFYSPFCKCHWAHCQLEKPYPTAGTCSATWTCHLEDWSNWQPVLR